MKQYLFLFICGLLLLSCERDMSIQPYSYDEGIKYATTEILSNVDTTLSVAVIGDNIYVINDNVVTYHTIIAMNSYYYYIICIIGIILGIYFSVRFLKN